MASPTGELGLDRTMGDPSFTERIMSTSANGISAVGRERRRFSTSLVFSSSRAEMWLITKWVRPWRMAASPRKAIRSLIARSEPSSGNTTNTFSCACSITQMERGSSRVPQSTTTKSNVVRRVWTTCSTSSTLIRAALSGLVGEARTFRPEACGVR